MKLKLKPDNTYVLPEKIDPNNRKIIFHHGRAPGDNIMFTAGIRDFKLLFPQIAINVMSPYTWLWENNPYLSKDLKRSDPGVEYYEVGYPSVASANNTNVHFTQMFLLDMIAITDLSSSLPISLGEFCAAFGNGDVGDPSLAKRIKDTTAKEPFIELREEFKRKGLDFDVLFHLRSKYRDFGRNFTRQRGDLHLSQEEKSYNLVKELYGVEKYWVIAPGGKRDMTAKIWDWSRFQDVIDYFDGKIKFVVMGRSDLLGEKFRNTIDLVDKFNGNPRGLIPLIYHADGCVAGPTLLMHMAAAVPPRIRNERKPCVSIFGGREPIGWSWYTNHQILHTNGAYTCCSSGGCWKARVFPLPKDPKHNKSLCVKPIESGGRTIQSCMNDITAQDVIRAIETYYKGDIYSYLKTPPKTVILTIPPITVVGNEPSRREINLVGNLNSSGGGEQSLCMVADVLVNSGWKVNLYPWGSIHRNYMDHYCLVKDASFENGMLEHMKPGLPLLFYANDCTNGFASKAEEVVKKSSGVIIGINYMNRPLPSCDWLAKSGKLKAVIFQNAEKRAEWEKDEIGYTNLKKIVLFGAINLNKFLEVCTKERQKDEKMVILKHCVADNRKYVTSESVGRGDKIHIWQKHLEKEEDTKFYTRLLKDVKDISFHFMAAPKELVEFFKNESRMVFYKWDEISVTEFLSKGHVYLYRTSNMWRDQYPRTVAEALAAGLPVLTEPRDGTKDRVIHGDTGFYFTHYDECLVHLKTLYRKEKFRQHLGRNAKDWAKENLDPRKWATTIEEVLDGAC